MLHSKAENRSPGKPRPAPWLFVTLLLATTMLVATVCASLILHQPIGKFTRDLAVIADVHPLAGVLSNLGILLWCASASVCLFSAAVLHGADSPQRFRVLVAAGLFSAYLLCDDLFMIHDNLAPHLLGINEKVVLAMIAIAGASYAAMLRRVLLQTNYAAFLVSIVALALSVASDTIFEHPLDALGQWSYLVEDGFKWIGITCWFSFHLQTSLAWVAAKDGATKPAIVSATAAATTRHRPKTPPGMSQPVGSC